MGKFLSEDTQIVFVESKLIEQAQDKIKLLFNADASVSDIVNDAVKTLIQDLDNRVPVERRVEKSLESSSL